MNDILGKKLEKVRINKVLPHINGELLDIGCGMNQLKSAYGKGTGVDVYDWGNVDIVVEDTSKLPFDDNSFDTITILAALNHIPNRADVIGECFRLLKPNGSVVITMIPPIISTVWHFLRKPWDVDQTERGMKEGEVYGLNKSEIVKLFTGQGFKLDLDQGFMLKINRLYVFKKE